MKTDFAISRSEHEIKNFLLIIDNQIQLEPEEADHGTLPLPVQQNNCRKLNMKTTVSDVYSPPIIRAEASEIARMK